MYANYHTHTARCKHAGGTEREYIECAIKAGMKVLGFSDHAPQIFGTDYVSGIRMLPEEAPEYVATLQALKKEYKNDIDIHIGFEAEYYPEIFDKLKSLCRQNGIEYLILGQHSIETDGTPDMLWCSGETADPERLSAYVDRVIEALSTGYFSYLAHPDIFHFVGDEKIYRKEMERLCVAAKSMNVPLEYNLLGVYGNRHYPCDRFFDIVKDVQNDVIIGCDAHWPTALSDTVELQEKSREKLEKAGLNVLNTLPFRKI